MNKQKLQEQIDTMREELAKMESKLAEFEKVELNQGEYLIWSHGDIDRISGVQEFKNDCTNSGATRTTKELAEIASKNMITRNRLEAYAHQIDPEWRDTGIGTVVYEIYSIGGYYKKYPHTNNRTLGAVYMSESTAEQICEWLNDGLISL